MFAHLLDISIKLATFTYPEPELARLASERLFLTDSAPAVPGRSPAAVLSPFRFPAPRRRPSAPFHQSSPAAFGLVDASAQRDLFARLLVIEPLTGDIKRS